MTPTKPAPPIMRPSRGTRQFGYGVAVVVNVVLLYVVNNLLDWDFPTFLTGDWERVLTILNISLIVGIGANLALIAYDERWFRSATNAVTSAFSLAVTIRMRQVFPFEFESDGWETFGRWLLIVLAVVIGLAMIVEATRAVGGLLSRAID